MKKNIRSDPSASCNFVKNITYVPRHRAFIPWGILRFFDTSDHQEAFGSSFLSEARLQPCVPLFNLVPLVSLILLYLVFICLYEDSSMVCLYIPFSLYNIVVAQPCAPDPKAARGKA